MRWLLPERMGEYVAELMPWQNEAAWSAIEDSINPEHDLVSKQLACFSVNWEEQNFHHCRNVEQLVKIFSMNKNRLPRYQEPTLPLQLNPDLIPCERFCGMLCCPP